ncbi:MAG TPA: protein-L-isoaspartate O-methyltransferase [Giesbergeria sp.]|nr:protein-L-isoaspartate O-methyltransferase [Giesbergeria sp.]HNE71376.1 protein-L-isoaspartate O-methyltransferase [Giesbergeria sp.]HNK06112.1 protein-L-isoaspartate O-methyltransferase [Giesbergeria sp.]HNN15515.1 protein-L-isoaspartate O-methyltransferase [Giesbergeria sp.]
MNMPLNTTADTSCPITQARYNMIEQQIRTWNVVASAVLETLDQVHREEFVPEAYRAMAFVDMEIPLQGEPQAALRSGQCMLKPNVEARMLQDLQLTKDDRVLEIGAGSGYMAALMAYQAAQVMTLELDPQLAQMARNNLERAGITNASVRQADGAVDSLPEGPFDAIVLSGSVAEVPARLLAQLSDRGRLLAITGQEPVMRVTLVRRKGDRFEVSYPWDVNAARLQHFEEPSTFQF